MKRRQEGQPCKALSPCPAWFATTSAMTNIHSLFVTRLYRAALSETGKAPDLGELEGACLSIAEDDEAGQK